MALSLDLQLFQCPDDFLIAPDPFAAARKQHLVGAEPRNQRKSTVSEARPLETGQGRLKLVTGQG
ncbi:hypothetical protein ARTHROSP310_35740 [Arthrobacter sp. AD-310]